MKAWFDKYFSRVFAAYLFGCSLWFVYVANWSAAAGYFCASTAWLLIWFLGRIYKKSLEEIDKMYVDTIEEIRQNYRESIERILGGKDAKA